MVSVITKYEVILFQKNRDKAASYLAVTGTVESVILTVSVITKYEAILFQGFPSSRRMKRSCFRGFRYREEGSDLVSITLSYFMQEKGGYFYILSNKKNGVLYTGMTNNLIRRITEHKEERIEGFSKRYGLHKLVYYEYYEHPVFAIQREKQIKAGNRAQKVALIESINSEWEDLFEKVKEIY